MRQQAKKILKNPLIYGSSIVVLGSLFANFFNFLFNLYMTRNLSNADYGVLASIISLISLPALMTGAIIPMVVQFAGNYFAKGEMNLVRGFYYQIKKYFLLFGVLVFTLLILLTPFISNFLHITDITLLILTSFVVFLGILHIINIAFIQAKMSFISIVSINVLAAVSKLLFGVITVLIGFKVNGAVLAIFLSSIIAYFASFWPIRFIFHKTEHAPKVNTKDLFKYGLSSTLTVIGITSFITADIILVKHFFDPTNAGIYAGLALIGRVIFYLASPIGAVMFSVVVQKYSNKENFVSTFLQALFLVLAPSLLLTIIYYIFPDPTILFFTKKTENLIVSPLLGLMGLYMTSYVVLYIVANFYLSINKTKISFPILSGALLQILCITLFHDNFYQIIIASLVITGTLNIFLLSYFFTVIQRRS